MRSAVYDEVVWTERRSKKCETEYLQLIYFIKTTEIVLEPQLGFRWCSQGPKFGPIPKGIKVTFFPNFE